MRVVGEREMNKGRLQGLTGGPHMQRRRLPKPPFAPAGRASHAHALVARSRRVGPLHRRPTTRKRKKKGRGGGGDAAGPRGSKLAHDERGGKRKGEGEVHAAAGLRQGNRPKREGVWGVFLIFYLAITFY
jgi:hypothetical protein